MWGLLISDQQYRDQYERFRWKYGKKSVELDSLKRLQHYTDSVNILKLEQIIAKTGWPTKSEVGREAASAAFSIIQHAGLKTQKKYLQTIKKLAFEKEISPQSYAYLQDRVLVSEDKKQLYGTQIHFNETTGKRELFPVKDIENIDKRRKDLGMMPINDYLKMFGIDYEK